MYVKNSSVVKLNGTITQEFPVASGVRQGDVLSPLLFNIFINDIIEEFQQPECNAPSLIDKDVGCLLYADDLVILSTSAEGLDQSLRRLASYCKKWKLQVNLAKSKIMCMSKKKEAVTTSIKYNGTELEQVESYSYLGIDTSHGGSFKTAEKSISLKAQKALFKLKSLLTESSLKPSTCVKMFEQLIQPICLYGSEIWSIDDVKCNSIIAFMKSLELFSAEKLNLSFSKFSLGVHKKAQNSAVRGELGRYPLGIEIVTNLLMYYYHIKHSTSNSLLQEAFHLSKLNGTKGWTNKIEQITYFIETQNKNTKISFTRKFIKQCLQTLYREYWHTNIRNEQKMRTYINFKVRFQYEKYLDDLESKHRKSLTRLRISAHNLEIERGRYCRPPVPCDLRICPHCPSYVQDEIHFLFKCSAHNDYRDIMLNKVTNMCPNFPSLSHNHKMFYLLNSEGDLLKTVANFVHTCLP